MYKAMKLEDLSQLDERRSLRTLEVLLKKEMKKVLRVKLLQPHAHMLRGEAGGTKIKLGIFLFS